MLLQLRQSLFLYGIFTISHDYMNSHGHFVVCYIGASEMCLVKTALI